MSMRSGDGFQFAHVDWSSRAGTAKKTAHNNNGNSTRNKSWSAREIADEAERIDGACDHVENPQPPTLLYGVMPHAAVDQAEAWAAGQFDTYKKTTKKGEVEIKRGYRADAPIMSNGVISMPREREADWPAFRDASLRWLKGHYRERLLSVVEHLDERHPHLHFYCVPLPGEDFGAVHAGYSASRQARGKDNQIRTAYKAAMTTWQDDFHNAVAQHFGLARFGPKRERTDRETALADRLKRELEAKQHDLAAAEKALIEAQKTLLRQAGIFKQEQKKIQAEKLQWKKSGARIGAIFDSARDTFSSSKKAEIEKLKAEKLEAEKRVSQAVKAESARWSPALKEARDDARYEKMKREEAETARRAAENQLAELRHRLNPGNSGYDSGYNGPK